MSHNDHITSSLVVTNEEGHSFTVGDLLCDFAMLPCPICKTEQNQMDAKKIRTIKLHARGLDGYAVEIPVTCRRNHVWYFRISNLRNEVVINCHTRALE